MKRSLEKDVLLRTKRRTKWKSRKNLQRLTTGLAVGGGLLEAGGAILDLGDIGDLGELGANALSNPKQVYDNFVEPVLDILKAFKRKVVDLEGFDNEVSVHMEEMDKSFDAFEKVQTVVEDFSPWFKYLDIKAWCLFAVGMAYPGYRLLIALLASLASLVSKKIRDLKTADGYQPQNFRTIPQLPMERVHSVPANAMLPLLYTGQTDVGPVRSTV